MQCIFHFLRPSFLENRTWNTVFAYDRQAALSCPLEMKKKHRLTGSPFDMWCKNDYDSSDFQSRNDEN